MIVVLYRYLYTFVNWQVYVTHCGRNESMGKYMGLLQKHLPVVVFDFSHIFVDDSERQAVTQFGIN